MFSFSYQLNAPKKSDTFTLDFVIGICHLYNEMNCAFIALF